MKNHTWTVSSDSGALSADDWVSVTRHRTFTIRVLGWALHVDLATERWSRYVPFITQAVMGFTVSGAEPSRQNLASLNLSLSRKRKLK